MENGLSGCGKWMWKVESGKWRGSGSHIVYKFYTNATSAKFIIARLYSFIHIKYFCKYLTHAMQ